MKLLTTLAILLSLHTSAQLSKKPGSYISIVAAGAFDGVAENLKFHHLGQGNQFWDADISWTNKYKNHNPVQGPKFIGSTTVFVWTTDGYHLMRAGRNLALSSTISFLLTANEKKKWYWYVIDGIVHMIAYRAGFAITYYLIK